MRNEIWSDGQLIEIIELDDIIDEIPITDEVTIPVSAIDALQATLEDPSTNSIAKIKTALTEFLEQLRG
jgi:hypothetical protein